MTKSRITIGRRAMLAAMPIALVALAGCAQNFRSDVTRFQTQLPAPQGQTFAVVAEDPALAGGIEFGMYSDLVEARLTQLGYVEAPAASATLLVHFNYSIDNGRERVRSTGLGRDPFYSPWFSYRRPYLRSRAWGYGFYDPWFDNDVESYTVYTSGIELKIDNAADGKRLFEGRAQAISTSNKLQYLVPNLVEAMFTDFPGNSGETLRISIAPEKK